MSTTTVTIPTAAWPLSSIVRWAERHGWGDLHGRRYSSVRHLLQYHAALGRRARGVDVAARFTGRLWEWAEAMGVCRKTVSRARYLAEAVGIVRHYTAGTMTYGTPTPSVLEWSKAALIDLLVSGLAVTTARRDKARADHAARVATLATDRIIILRPKRDPVRLGLPDLGITAGHTMGTPSPPSFPKGEDSPRPSPPTDYTDPSTPPPMGVVDAIRTALRGGKPKRPGFARTHR